MAIASTMPKPAKVGDTFVHANPGFSDDPNKPNKPFAIIYQVVEVKDGKARVFKKYAHLDSREELIYDRWENAYGLGQYDRKINK